jgi:branched-chain amino acid transport system substrate-binding protein
VSKSLVSDAADAKSYRRERQKKKGAVSGPSFDRFPSCFQAPDPSGNANGDTLMAAMKGMSWESPRGQIAIDPETRDIIQNEYIRRVEQVNGELYNVEFATIEAVKDPFHGGKK